MNYIAIFDLISVLGFLIAMIILVKRWQRPFDMPHARLLFAVLVLFSLAYSGALFLEWSGIEKDLNFGEDLIGALMPMIWIFFFYAFLQNITTHDLRQSEQILKESTRNLNNLMTNLPGMAYRCLNDGKWSMVFVSQGCLELTGYEPDELMRNGFSYSDLIHKRDQDTVMENFQKKLEKKEPFQLVYRIRTAKGEEKWVWEQGAGIFSSADGLLAVEGFITDITEKKIADASLEKDYKNLKRAHNLLEEELKECNADITVSYRKYLEYDKVYVIGDIHGSVDMLKKLMDIIPWRMDRDLLIFLGDYMDRGNQGKEVVDYIISLKKSSEHVRCLLGNHDAMFLDYLNGENIEQFIANGGDKTLLSYGITNREEGYSLVPEEHVRFFRSLEPYIELEDYYFVHAGFRPGVKINEQKLQDMLWIRKSFIDSKYDFGKKVIFGHTPLSKPLVMKNKIGIDTGAAYGEKLTCLELPKRKFYSVE